MDNDTLLKEKEWQQRKQSFQQKQDEYNLEVNSLKQDYLLKKNYSINNYTKLILENSDYPFLFKKEIYCEYNPQNKILVVDYYLPAPKYISTLKSISFVASQNEIKEKHISEKQKDILFDQIIYKITLRSLKELFSSDYINCLEAVSFNGWVKSINKATGIEGEKCILSLQVKKEELIYMNLENVDPKLCFRNLKGIGSSKLSSLSEIQPIITSLDSDKRFVDSKNVDFDDTTNLALMNWEEFEHLIRELFEKEFSNNGSQVKVTQASRDGGVDAIAFDSDPIRGGKIVIQAKRYTNTVGVAAVRDLYGTVMNEGANKGILVTTSDYGSDSYNFAKGKPLTLLNGGNLLHLLEKHGTKARIDIKEAKKILNDLNEHN
ncbi:restriction endonuclease [Formosa sp. PL04]|uniref:restriction endonuclease n=1 Tax=Formosa sp. PL04 TaxID=3081755 RepID=UPI0029815877|nr:restriction endonuclease [Formosa sp. PL04]MDW5288509.1 restriction endonuclease [Formosa sp. PL04]